MVLGGSGEGMYRFSAHARILAMRSQHVSVPLEIIFLLGLSDSRFVSSVVVC